MLYSSEGDTSEDIPRASDPAVIIDDDGSWIFFGREAGGIYFAELDADTNFLKENPTEHNT